MNRRLQVILLLLTLPFFHNLQGQKSATIDSLQRLLVTGKQDTTRVNVLNGIGHEYSNDDPDSAIIYCMEALGLAEKLQYHKGAARAHNVIGVAYDSKGEFKKALEHYWISLEISDRNRSAQGVAISYNDIGIIYYEMAKYDSALMYFEVALHLKDSINDRTTMASTLSNMALVFSDQGNTDKAIENLYKALAFDVELGDKQGMADSYLNIGTLYKNDGNCAKAMESFDKAVRFQLEVGDNEGLSWSYSEMAGCYLKQKDYQRALENYKKGLATAEMIDLKIMIGNTHQGLGDVYLAQGQYPEAHDEYQQALRIASEVGNVTAEISGMNSLGNVYVLESNTVAALDEYQQALKKAKDAGFLVGLRDSYRGLSTAYEQRKDLVQALAYFKLFTMVNDSLLNIEKQEKVALLHTQYETQKKDEEIASLNTTNQLQQSENRKQKILRNAFIGGFVLVLILAFVLFNSYRNKKRTNAALKAKNKVIKEQKKQVEQTLQELQESEKQLIQAEKMASLGQLTAGIAHEINNPINFVSSNINPLKRNFTDMKELLQQYEQLLSDTDQREALVRLRKEYDIDLTLSESAALLNGIEEGSKRTAEIVKGLRNFSRIDESEMKKTNVNEGVESTLLLLQNKFHHQHIDVVKQLNDVPLIDAYAGQVNQVFMNLLTNAIDAIGSDGKVFITTSAEDSVVKISVRDTGNGMSEEVMSKIFDPFFTTKEVGKGSGLGLSISYGIIEKHQGRIDVKSEIGRGTEFIVRLPIVRST